MKAWWVDQVGTRCPTVDQLIDDGQVDEDSTRTDPWGRPWRIVCDGKRVSVGSDGPDRETDTDDDIRVPPV